MKVLLSTALLVGWALTLTFLFPGRTDATGCSWTPQKGYIQSQQQPPVVDIYCPVEGSKLAGEPQGTRGNLTFSTMVVVRVWPSRARSQITGVTVYFKKGANEGYVPAAWWEDCTDGCSYYRGPLEITTRYTSAAEGDYELRATCVLSGYAYGSRNRPHFRIAKGRQMWCVATANGGNTDLGSWLHYPYHYGSKGPFSPGPADFSPSATGPLEGRPITLCQRTVASTTDLTTALTRRGTSCTQPASTAAGSPGLYTMQPSTRTTCRRGTPRLSMML